MQLLVSQGTRAKQGGDLKLAIITFAAGWLIIAWPWLSGHVTVPWDSKAHFLPQLQFMAASFAKGESPFWTPYVFSGSPQIADPQSLLFSPPYVLLALLNSAPTAWAQDVTLELMLLVSGLCMILWFRDKGWHAAGGLLAALSFAFGAAMAWRVQHVGQVMSLAYLPAVLLCLDRALERRSLTYAIAAGAIGGILVIGRDQVALLSVYFLIAYVAHIVMQKFRQPAGAKFLIPPLVVATIAGLLVIAIPVTLTHLVVADANRPFIPIDVAGHGSVHPALFLTALAPDVFASSGGGIYWGPPSALWKDTGLYLAQNMGQMYFGAVPILLFFWGALSGIFSTGNMRVFAAGLAVSAIYALGWYTPAFAAMHAVIPGVDLYRRPADAIFLIGFFGSVMAGYDLHRLLTDPWIPVSVQRRIVMVGIPVAAFAIMIGLASHFGTLDYAWRPIAIAAVLTAIAAILLWQARHLRVSQPRLAAAVITLFTAGDLAYSNGPGGATALPPAEYDVLEISTANPTIALLKKLTSQSRSDTRRDRIELAGLGFHWPNASLTHELENTLGYNPIQLGAYSRASGSGVNAGLPSDKGFSVLMPSYRSPFSDLLGLRYIATGVPIEKIDPALKPGELPLIAKTADGYVYENTHALPRVLFAQEAQIADFEGLLTTGNLPTMDFTSTVLLETARPTPGRGPGSVRIVSYHNTEIQLATDSPDGGWVVLNDIWQPWWFADVDGKDVPVLKANVLFRAVEVSPGRHTVTYRFRPLAGAWKQLRGKAGI